MPIYEYRCEKCGDFELTQRISDPPAQRCPTCRKKVRRLISNTSFQLKGSGWYVTDYGRGGSKKGGDDKAGGASTEGTSDSKSDAKTTADTKSDSKPAKKAEKKSEAKTSAAVGSGGKS